jgi:flagellar assembly protein FliH
MHHATASADVLRGLALQGAPLRLGRARPGEAQAPVPAPEVSGPAASLQEERALVMREAREQGLREGRAEGLREGRAQAAEEIPLALQRAVAEAVLPLEQEHAQLLQMAQGLGQAIADALAAAQDEMAALCFETLCRMFGATAVDPQTVRAQLAHLVREHGSGDVVLHLHPQDVRLLESRPGEASQARVRWVADAEVALGGCILQTASGGLDARLETMLEACKAALLAARRQQCHAADAGEGR